MKKLGGQGYELEVIETPASVIFRSLYSDGIFMVFDVNWGSSSHPKDHIFETYAELAPKATMYPEFTNWFAEHVGIGNYSARCYAVAPTDTHDYTSFGMDLEFFDPFDAILFKLHWFGS